MDFYQAIKNRVSTRKYKSDTISEEVLGRVLDAARLAPSGKNGQPWIFIVVRDNEIRNKLVWACKDQRFIQEAPVTIVACGYESRAYNKMGGYWNSLPVDIGISLEHLILAAEVEGLGTCWIGAFDEEEVRKLLSVPKEVKILALTPLGYPDCEKSFNSRKSLDEIVMYDKWQNK